MILGGESFVVAGKMAALTDYNSPGTPSRHEKSLGLLTAKFVNLLQEAKDGVLDLKVVGPNFCISRH